MAAHRFGTSHFWTRAHAIRYYREYGEDAAGVERKIAAGEISIGPPPIDDAMRCAPDADGRYWMWVEDRPYTRVRP